MNRACFSELFLCQLTAGQRNIYYEGVSHKGEFFLINNDDFYIPHFYIPHFYIPHSEGSTFCATPYYCAKPLTTRHVVITTTRSTFIATLICPKAFMTISFENRCISELNFVGEGNNYLDMYKIYPLQSFN